MLTPDEIVRGLVAQGVPRDVAERQARRATAASPTHNHAMVPGPYGCVVCRAEEAAPVVLTPISLRIPWSALVSDNDRKEPYVVKTANGPRARMRLTAEYATALERIKRLAADTMGDRAPYAIPLAITVRVWLPGGSARNDAINFSKLVGDALEGVVYTNDNLLHESHWYRMGSDVDAPRAEISISPLL